MQQIVEIVGDPARENPDALQLLYVTRLSFAGLRSPPSALLPLQELVRELLGGAQICRALRHSGLQLGVQPPNPFGQPLLLGNIADQPPHSGRSSMSVMSD